MKNDVEVGRAAAMLQVVQDAMLSDKVHYDEVSGINYGLVRRVV